MTFPPKKKPEPLEAPDLYEYAVGALARRMRTIAELKRLMHTRVEAGETGEANMLAVITRLKENGYLNDALYATYYTRLRQENEKFGKRRVQQELARKGVDSELISTTLDTAYEHISEEDLARKHLERKRIKQPTNEKETARVVRAMIRGGFSTRIIFKVLKSWQVNDETLSALETLDMNDTNDNAGPE